MLSFLKSQTLGKTLFFIFFLLSTFLYSTIINVPADQPTIQAGIDVSVNADTVLVQSGTYLENIYFNGKLITIGSLFLTTQDTSYISSTIIDGNGSGSVVSFEGGEESSSILTGFTITNGNTNMGGGIYCEEASPSLINLIITNNYVSNLGGGIYCADNSSLFLQNVTITDNSAEEGGGIYSSWNSNANLENVTINNNSADYGGGIFCTNTSPILQNVTISGNSAVYSGGGIYCYNTSNPSLENMTIANNSAGNSGGGIYCNDSNPTIINSIMWNNPPEEIYIYASGSVTASYSDIQGELWTGTGNINTDPLFVNSGSGDYHLQTTSPCIDAGDPVSPADPDGTIADMGAYYYDQILNPIPPIADFTVDATNGSHPLTVNFTDLSTQGSGVIDEWYWDFGDGNNSSLQNPVSEYLLPGIYTVSLTVTDVNDSTDTETKLDYITVVYGGPVWHISTAGSDVTGTGSEQYPFATIQHGINTSSNIDTILVQPGIYVENINFNGKLVTVASLYLITQDTTYISSTIIDGNSNGSVVTFENAENSSAVLCGFSITNGTSTTLGGGIYCEGSSPSLENVTISGNSAVQGAGGIYCYNNSNPSLDNLIVSSNSSDVGGGIVCNDNSSPSLDNVIISGNSVSGTNGYGGGFVCSINSNPILQNVTITGNSASFVGGGIYLENADPFLLNVTITDNSTIMAGGGIFLSSSDPDLRNVTISDNHSSNWGGGIYCSNSAPVLENVTITGNTATIYGGGIYCYVGSAPILISSIMWNDSPQEIFFSGTLASNLIGVHYSDIQGGEAGIVTNSNGSVNWGDGNIDADPLFVDPVSGDYHLQSTSPCIDAGYPGSPIDPDGTNADMGAYYFPQFINADFTVDTTNGYFPLTVNFTDISIQGSGVIDEWYWDFGDGNNSSLQNPAHEYLLLGNYTVSLTVTADDDSTDTETKVDYITVYGYDPPAPPTNVQVEIVPPDAIITWAEVDTTIFGDPTVVDYYLIYGSYDPYSEFMFLSAIPDTSFTQTYGAAFNDKMFYHIKSFIGTSDELDEYVERYLRKSKDKYWIER